METHTHPAFDPDHPNPQDSPTSPAQPEAEARPAPAMPAGIYPESPATPIAPIQPNMAPPANSIQQKGMFSGRLNRIGFFLAGLYAVLPLIVILLLQVFFHNSSASKTTSASINIASVLVGLISCVLILPIGISINIRRWHDLNKSGWYTLLGFIPFVSIIVGLYILFAPGTRGPNSYGEPDTAPSTPKKVLFNR